MSEHAMIIAEAVGRIVPLAVALGILWFIGCALLEDWRRRKSERGSRNEEREPWDL
jgi:hypothetical protein